MYGLAEICTMNEEATKKAKGKKPLVFVGQDFTARRLPNFGNYRPKDWKMIESHFVDSSGFGRENELALTFPNFYEKLVLGHGYAIIEAGQFQVYVGEFVKL